MKTEDCPVYQLIRKKVDSTRGSRRLTKRDREEVDKGLRNCGFICDNPYKCDKLNNIISDFSPPECRGSDHANAKSRTQEPTPYELPQLHIAYQYRIPMKI